VVHLTEDSTARLPRPGYEQLVPRTPDEFARAWRESPERKDLLLELDEHDEKYPQGKQALDEFMEASKQRKSKHVPKKSPYTVTIWMEIGACIIRAYRRMWGDKSTLGAHFGSQIMMSLVLGSVFYNTPDNTNGFFSKVIFG
jgi:ATP-binding cassette, subfamily G (WHITE), member 2, PDR